MDSTLYIVIGAVVAVVIIILIIVFATRASSKRKRASEEKMLRRAERAAAREEKGLREDLVEAAIEAEEAAGPDTEDELNLDELMEDPPEKAEIPDFDFISETTYLSIKAPEPCGFDFGHVVVGYRGKGKAPDPTAGRMGLGSGEPLSVYAQGANFEKIVADLGPLMPLFRALSEPKAQIVYKAVFPDMPGLLAQMRPFGEKSTDIKGIDNVPVISVIDDANAKRAGVYPVSVRVAMLNQDVVLEKRTNSAIEAAKAVANVPHLLDDADYRANARAGAELPDSLVLDLYYEPSGRATKGRVVAWKNKNGYLCEFVLGRVSGDYIPTSLKVTNTPGVWFTVF